MSEVRKMAELLRGGAKMLSATCPECCSILFKVNDDIICPKCNKKIVIVKDTQDTETLTKTLLLDQVEKTTINKISEIELLLREENNPQELERTVKILSTLLKVLERIKLFRGSR